MTLSPGPHVSCRSRTRSWLRTRRQSRAHLRLAWRASSRLLRTGTPSLAQLKQLRPQTATILPAHLPSQRRCVGAIKTTLDSSARSRASFAGGPHQMLITSASPSRGHSGVRSATNSRSRFAGRITGLCITRAMNALGGQTSTSIRCPSRSSSGVRRGDRLRARHRIELMASKIPRAPDSAGRPLLLESQTAVSTRAVS